MDKSILRVVAAATAAVLAGGCVSTTVIKSQPPGAKVYLDGAFVGQTPYEMSDTKIVGSITHVKLHLEGYAESNVLISRNERFDAGACLGGVLVLFPFLWIQGYNPEHVYEMSPLRYPPGYPQYQGYPPPGYPQQGYPPPGYPYPPPQPYPQQPQAYPPPPQGYPPPQPGATPPPPAPQGAFPQPPQGGAPAQMAPPPQGAPAPAPQAPAPAPAQNPAPAQAAPR
jgi:hypothetical protein